jgi:Fe-S-cluster containining protein
VTPPPAPRVRALSFHAGYRCRNTGVCCSSGWDIPVEPEVETHLRSALRSGRLRTPEAVVSSPVPGTGAWRAVPLFRSVTGLPHGAKVVFVTNSSGHCVFLDPDRLCAVHGQLGPEALPSACRDFPRVVTLTPLGVSITLSHHCPTAAGLLFAPVTLSDPRLPGREGSAFRILEDPPGFPPTWPYEGLDARDALPPLLRPGVLMDWPSLERWEAFAVSVLGDERRSPEAALEVLAAAAEEARRWEPADGAFGEYFPKVLERTLGKGISDPWDPAVRGSQGWLLPPLPERLEDVDRRLVVPGWPSLAVPIRRWLAAKAFASWLALQGEGLRTTALGLRVALGVLRAEAARGCAGAGRTLDAALLEEAVRRADLILVHLSDPAALAKRLSRCEASGPTARA